MGEQSGGRAHVVDAAGEGDFDFLCSVCGKLVARFELLATGVARRLGDDHPAWDIQKLRLYFWSFERSGDSAVDPSKYRRLLSAVESNNWGALYVLDWHYAVPWCRQCDRLYCDDHWAIESDNSVYCSEWGTCPNGHGKILDD